jgi:hypothetical protein
MDMTNNKSFSREEMEHRKSLAFEESRFKYCVKLYDGEVKRQRALETKSQFYLSFATLFLGAIFLKLEFIENLGSLLTQQNISHVSSFLICVFMVILAASLIVGVFSILQSMRVQDYKHPYPQNISEVLFAPDSNYLENEDSSTLLKTVALNYSLALEKNKKVNDKKASCLKIVNWSIFLTIASSSFLTVIIYQLLL